MTTRAKVLELIFQGKDEVSSTFQSTSREAARSASTLENLNQRYATLRRTQESFKQSLRELDAQRAQLRRRLDGPGPAEAEANAIRQRRRELFGIANNRTVDRDTRGRAVEQLKQQRERLLQLEQRITAEGEKQTAVRRRLVDLDRQRSRLVERQRRAGTAENQLATNARAQARLAIERSTTTILERRARLGDREAAQQLRIQQLRAAHRAEAQGLVAITRSRLTTDQQRIAAETRLLQLYRLQRREIAQAAGTQRGGRLAGVGRGAFTGATAAGFGPLAGIGALASTGAGLPVAGAAVGAYALTSGLGASVRVAAEFEQSMSRVKALTGASADEMQRLQEQAMLLGRTTVFTAPQAGEAQQSFALAGFTPDQILKATPPALRLAAAGQIELGEAAKITSRIMAGMGITADEVGGAIDILANAFTTANTDLSELGTGMSYVGPIAKAANKELAETTAVLQALANAGFNGEKGGTAFRQILIKLTNTTGSAQDRLEQLGIVLTDDAGNLLNMAQIVENFDNALAGLGSAERLKVLSEIFEARAAAGFAALMGQGAESIRNFEAAAESAGGAAERVAETQLDNLSGSMTRLKSAAQGVGIQIGETLSPALRDAADDAGELLNVISDLIAKGGEFKEFTQSQFRESIAGNPVLPVGLINEVLDGAKNEYKVGLLDRLGYGGELANQAIGTRREILALREVSENGFNKNFGRDLAQQKDYWASPAGQAMEARNAELERGRVAAEVEAARRQEIYQGFENPEGTARILEQFKAKPASELEALRSQMKQLNDEATRQGSVVEHEWRGGSYQPKDVESVNALEKQNQLLEARKRIEERITDVLDEQSERYAALARSTDEMRLAILARGGDAEAAAELARGRASRPYEKLADQVAEARPGDFWEGIIYDVQENFLRNQGRQEGDRAATQSRLDENNARERTLARLELAALRDRAEVAAGPQAKELGRQIKERELELQFEARRQDITRRLGDSDDPGTRQRLSQLLNELPQLLSQRLDTLNATPTPERRDPLEARLRGSVFDRRLGNGADDPARQTADNTRQMVEGVNKNAAAIKQLADYLKQNQRAGRLPNQVLAIQI